MQFSSNQHETVSFQKNIFRTSNSTKLLKGLVREWKYQ